MSENISIPAARVPLVDDRGLITREWMAWFIGMFQRVGGPQGFSNQELYGDAVALQSYDELLERIGALEAQARDLRQAMAMMALGGLEQFMATPPVAISPDTFARIKVLGETDLAMDSGNVRIRKGINGSTAVFQVNGESDQTGNARFRAGLHVNGGSEVDLDSVVHGTQKVGGTSEAASFLVGGQQVVGARVPGNPAFSAYAGQTMGAAYSQSQAQTNDNAVKAVSTAVAALVTAMRTHGLIGD